MWLINDEMIFHSRARQLLDRMSWNLRDFQEAIWCALCAAHLLACYRATDGEEIKVEIKKNTELSIFNTNVADSLDSSLTAHSSLPLDFLNFFDFFFITLTAANDFKKFTIYNRRAHENWNPLQLQSNMCWSSNEPSAQKSILFSFLLLLTMFWSKFSFDFTLKKCCSLTHLENEN